MRFQVPQFIEVEDKIFGQFTIKQFIYLAGGAGLSFAIYRVIGTLIWSILPIIIVIAFSLALSFYKINERFPFIYIVEAAVKYFFSNKLYIWKKRENKKIEGKNIDSEIKKYASIMVPKISDSKLKDLTWSLDIKESMYTNKNQR